MNVFEAYEQMRPEIADLRPDELAALRGRVFDGSAVRLAPGDVGRPGRVRQGASRFSRVSRHRRDVRWAQVAAVVLIAAGAIGGLALRARYLSEERTAVMSGPELGVSARRSADAPPGASDLRFSGELRARYGPTDAQLAVIWEAQQRALSDCMADRGFDRPMIPWVAPESRLHDLETPRSHRQAHGFAPLMPGLVVSPEEQLIAERVAADDAYSEALTGARDGALDPGDPRRSCNAQASETVFGYQGSPYQGIADLGNLDVEAHYAAIADPEMVAVEAAWAECMNAAGLPFSRRDELLETIWPDPSPTAAEITAATTDWDCLTETGYRAVFSRVYLSYIDRLVVEYELVLTELMTASDANVAAANEYLDRS